MDPKARQEGENSRASGPAKFGGLDQLDWLMIVMVVFGELSPGATTFWIFPIGSSNGFFPSS